MYNYVGIHGEFHFLIFHIYFIIICLYENFILFMKFVLDECIGVIGMIYDLAYKELM